jgi:hypothetical protein
VTFNFKYYEKKFNKKNRGFKKKVNIRNCSHLNQHIDIKEIYLAKINNCIFLAALSEQFDDEVNLEDAYIEDLILIYKTLSNNK